MIPRLSANVLSFVCVWCRSGIRSCHGVTHTMVKGPVESCHDTMNVLLQWAKARRFISVAELLVGDDDIVRLNDRSLNL